MRNCNIALRDKLHKSFFLFMGLGFLVLCVFTLVLAEASKVNRLGYCSICSYSPISSVILLSISAVMFQIALKKGQKPSLIFGENYAEFE